MNIKDVKVKDLEFLSKLMCDSDVIVLYREKYQNACSYEDVYMGRISDIPEELKDKKVRVMYAHDSTINFEIY